MAVNYVILLRAWGGGAYAAPQPCKWRSQPAILGAMGLAIVIARHSGWTPPVPSFHANRVSLLRYGLLAHSSMSSTIVSRNSVIPQSCIQIFHLPDRHPTCITLANGDNR